MENRCVCCGEIIPEGRMVCPQCEAKHLRGDLSCQTTVQNVKIMKHVNHILVV
mgnify:CR=1 FL=1